MTRTLTPPCRGLAQQVDAALSDYVDRLPLGCPAKLRNAMAHSLLAPGKRLRPLLVLLATQACGGESEEAMPAACAVEMVHTYSLIHDDLPSMDNDDLRRGRASCHAAFGEAAAILAGDALLAWSFEILATDVKPWQVAAECCQILAQAAGPANLVGGQADDLFAAETSNHNELLHSIHHRKTGALLVACLKLGAAIAEADAASRQALEGFGTGLGIAFQIVDDLLDLESDDGTLGKHAGKDAEQGKLTFPRLFGVSESRQEANRQIGLAREHLKRFGPSANPLHEVAQFVIERNL